MDGNARRTGRSALAAPRWLLHLPLALVAPGIAFGMRQLRPPDLGPPYLLFLPPILVVGTERS